MNKIPLTNGGHALVDSDDHKEISARTWRRSKDGYAEAISSVNGRIIRAFMHRLINNTPDDLLTDHINGDRLDNRKINLRSCTIHENARNRCPDRQSLSKYKGVTRSKRSRKWQVQIVKKYVGVFATEEAAAEAYNEQAKKLFGQFAYLNSIPPHDGGQNGQ